MTTALLAEVEQLVGYGLEMELWQDLRYVENAGPNPTNAIALRIIARRINSTMSRLFIEASPFQVSTKPTSFDALLRS
jgi:hypothetical protein